jgi:hypothetical protein
MIVLRYGLPVLMLLHGIAHLPGVLASWRLAVLSGFPYHTTVLGGRFDVGDGGMRALGALWLAAGLGFALVAIGAFIDHERWVPLAIGVMVLSLVLCALEWPAARIGLAVNVALLAVLPFAVRFVW